jgi:two-component system, chemotaxis family, protein-glutamate methylesterase/glutaminase
MTIAHAPNRLVRVLVVDDSAYVRKMVTQMLSRNPLIEVVGTARDGSDALERVAALKPDVVVCDLIMPHMDGLEFVQAQMARHPLPIVIVSIASGSGERALASLDAGAFDFVQKPTALASDKLLDIADELIEKVRAAAGAPMRRAVATLDVRTPRSPSLASSGAFDIVVVGISTGGPQALRYLIPQLPVTLSVPIAVVLHMPVGYTEMYARKLQELSALSVTEAREGDEVKAGSVFIAPAGRHLTFRREGPKRVVAHLDVQPLDSAHRPSADVLFQSAVEVYGSRVLGLVMTGMGADGREGAAWIKAQGGTVLTEAEETCVVYGMPRSVVEAGLSDASVPLDRLAAAIQERV